MVGEEGVVFDPRTNTTHALNRSSLEVWRLCDGEHTPRQMADALRGLFDVPPDQAARDVESLLTQFAQLDLLAGSEDPPET